jgi:FkbM family methyltransferase
MEKAKKMKRLIFDIGANKGEMANFFLNHTEKVICFEPNPTLIDLLKRRFSTSDKIVIDSRGLSDKIEEKTFNISNADTISTFSEDWISNSRFANQYRWDTEVKVQTTTIDQAIEEYGIPDFVKIDVEGYELEVISGLTKLHKETTFSFEWAEEQYDRMKRIAEYLINLGYSKFAFTYGDAVTFGDDLQWSTWNELSLHTDINVNRKWNWGMILFKY